jgi:hypothetical protein
VRRARLAPGSLGNTLVAAGLHPEERKTAMRLDLANALSAEAVVGSCQR